GDVLRGRRRVGEVDGIRQRLPERQPAVGVSRLWAGDRGQALGGGALQVARQIERYERRVVHGRRAVDLELRRQASAAGLEPEPRDEDPERLEVGRLRQPEVVILELGQRRDGDVALYVAVRARAVVKGLDRCQQAGVIAVPGTDVLEEVA